MEKGSYFEKGKCFFDGPGCEEGFGKPLFRGMGVLQYREVRPIIWESNGGVKRPSRPSIVSMGEIGGGATFTKSIFIRISYNLVRKLTNSFYWTTKRSLSSKPTSGCIRIHWARIKQKVSDHNHWIF